MEHQAKSNDDWRTPLLGAITNGNDGENTTDETMYKSTDEVIANLKEFVKYFVKEIESKLCAYNLVLEGEIKKAGKFSDAFSKRIGQGIGGAVGGVLGQLICAPAAGACLGAKGGELLTGEIGNAAASEHYRKKVIKLKHLVDRVQNDKANLRRELVEVGFDIFQSYEMQFTGVKTDQGSKQAMQLLARDAANRLISYSKEHEHVKSMLEGVVFGKSKIEPVLGVPVATSYIKAPGFTIYYGSSKTKWSTASLYEKVGLVREGIYYEKKDGKSRVGKYGHRRLLKSEDWNESEASWIQLEPSDVKSRFKNYPYVLCSENFNRQTVLEKILEKINANDKELMEERIRELLEEVKSDLIKEIQTLKDHLRPLKWDTDGHTDHQILTNIVTNLENLEVDKYIQKFELYFQEAKKKLQEMSKSINQMKQKQNIYHEENQTEHKKTQEKLDRLIKGSSRCIKKSIWFDVKDPVEQFTGRKKELHDLHNIIRRNPEKPTVITQMISITGLGGIGKTELARQYIHQHHRDFDDNVIWISAESEATLIQSFSTLAKDRLKIETKDANGKEKDIRSVVDEVYTFFKKRKSLFIFDNAEKNDYFRKFLPFRLGPNSKKPYILITSRNREWEQVIDLDVLTLEDAIDLVKRKLGIQDESQNEEITELVEKLQRFPLAIQQATAYIQDQRLTGKFSISDYLQEYEEKTKDLLNSKVLNGIINDYEKTTFTTWKITIDKIASDQEHGELASDILNAVAYFAPQNIIRDMFLDLAGGDETKLKSAVRLLVKYSMVNGEENQSVLSIHRLVQEVIRLELRGQGKEKEILKKDFDLLKKIFPFESDQLEDFAKRRQQLPHIEAGVSHAYKWLKEEPENEEKIEKNYLQILLTSLSKGYNDLGDPKKETELLEKVLAIQKRHFGSESIEVAKTLQNLGNAYGDLGDPEKKKELLEKALEIQEKYYEPEQDHYKVARTLADLGDAYSALGDPEKQKELLERALPIQEKHYGTNHVEVARTLVNLGNAYGDFGDLKKKKELLERALEIQIKHYNLEHFQVARTLRNLGIAYGHLGDFKKKKEFLEKALEIQEKHYGSEHFEVAKTLLSLGNAFGALGDPKKKKELLKRSFAILKEHYGPDHFEVASTLASLGNAYGILGYPTKQKELLESALKMREKRYGPDHFQVARTLQDLGKAYGDLGDPMKKKELQERALAIKEKHYKFDHFEVAITLGNLSNAYGDLGDPKKQKELAEKALAIKEKHYGLEHLEVASTLVNLGIAHGELEDHKKQNELLGKALVIQENHYGSDNFKVAKTLVNLAISHGNLHDHEKQKELLEKALEIQEKHYGPVHFEVAKTLVNLGIAHGDLGNTEKKRELIEKAVVILQDHYGSEHFEVAKALQNLGNAYGDLGDIEKKKELLEKALAIQEKYYGLDHLKVAKTLTYLGEAYKGLGNSEKQTKLLERAKKIMNFKGS